jgi:hypothetical protein
MYGRRIFNLIIGSRNRISVYAAVIFCIRGIRPRARSVGHCSLLVSSQRFRVYSDVCLMFGHVLEPYEFSSVDVVRVNAWHA